MLVWHTEEAYYHAEPVGGPECQRLDIHFVKKTLKGSADPPISKAYIGFADGSKLELDQITDQCLVEIILNSKRGPTFLVNCIEEIERRLKIGRALYGMSNDLCDHYIASTNGSPAPRAWKNH